ncbi:pleckstrin homology (PH) domain-containing protein [Tasmannia lanceolata]|uniref:pleckstrin homology (PH) domain-containing protein n=1 Tax=Tasmannia lanceolata TaxID=3420 RepID=UPI004062EDEC
MLEDQVAFLLQKYLGNYVRGLSKEALSISVWRGDVELTNMQLKPEALNALKLPVKVKAGFLGSVKIKVPWSRLGQEPVLVYLDRIFVLVEPATKVEGCSEDTVQEAKKIRVREMEMKLLESRHELKSEMNTSWLGSLINTIIGNLKLSVTNIHIRYEDLESNPGHPFAAGVTLAKLSAATVDESGKETFVTGGALEHIQKSVELERLALYFDSDIRPWSIDKRWEDLLPSEWSQVFEIESKDGKPANVPSEHVYILQPVTGRAKYAKLRPDESRTTGQPLQKATVDLDDVTLCISKDGYRDILKLADNFASFNQRLKYAHYRPIIPVKSSPSLWWKYAYKAVSDQMKKASGKLSWEQVLRYTRIRKRYISLYASLLKSDVNRLVVDDNKDIDELDRGLDIEVILQWRMLAHKFVEQSTESDLYLKKQKAKKSWWSLGWSEQTSKDENGPGHFNEKDWEQLNKIIGYKEGVDEQLLPTQDKKTVLHTFLEIHMKHNASKLITEYRESLAELSCEGLDCSVKLYSEAKVFDLKLGSYRLSSPNGVLAESAVLDESLVGVFSYKPFDAEVDWSLVAKASPCYMTYLKDSINLITSFFKSSTAVSQTIALETAAAVQMTIDEVKRTAQQQVTRALMDRSRFLLDLDIAAPKITIPTEFCPDNSNATKLLLDLGNLMLRTQDDNDTDSPESDMYLKFNLGLSDVSAFLVDGDYHWSQTPLEMSAGSLHPSNINLLPVIEKCGIVLKFQQIRSECPLYPSTRLAMRLPSLGFHFSPARYHRLMQVAKIFQTQDEEESDFPHPWNQADFEGWLSLLSWKGVGNREAVWQRRYICLVGPFLYILESPTSKTYKQYLSLRGKQVYQVPPELAGNAENVIAVCDVGQSNIKVVEHVNAFIFRCDTDDSRRTWQSRFQAAIYRASGSAAITSLSEMSSELEDTKTEFLDKNSVLEKVFITGVLDELRICFSCSHQSNQSFRKMLVANESPLLEFRAIGGQVELSIRANDMFIGTVLKSLEIEDLFGYAEMAMPRYLARSFIESTDLATSNASSSLASNSDRSCSTSDLTQIDGDDKFFEASDNLIDSVEYPVQLPGSGSKHFSSQGSLSSDKSSIKPPGFSRIVGLLPDAELRAGSEDLREKDTLGSFVKAQIVIYDQNSPLYNDIDKQVTVTLATLSFFCYRPTILAILKFVNAITIEEGTSDASKDIASSSMIEQDISRIDLFDDANSATVQEPVVKGLLGKGKSRVIFFLSLNMARAQILLMNENGTQLATLSQNNLLTDIKVFPSSFGIKASLGNLKISDDSLPSSHSYFWVCDMRNPGGSSFVELDFSSFSADDEDYRGYDFSLFGQLSEVRIVYLNRFVQEVASYFMGLVPSNAKKVVKIKDQVTNLEKWFTTSEIEGSPALKLDLSLRNPIIVMPRRTDSLDYLELDVLHITVQNTFQWLRGDKDEMGAVHMEILNLQVKDINLRVSTGNGCGESIIQDVKGISVVIRRSLRDLLHQIPATEASIKIEQLKAALSNREYQIITECALSNISETPHTVPPLDKGFETSLEDVKEHLNPLPSGVEFEAAEGRQAWITMKVSVSINLVELCLHSGVTRDAALATLQVSGVWLLYKSNSLGEGFLLATLKGLSVIDDREGTKQEFRLAIGQPESIGYTPLHYADDNNNPVFDSDERSIAEVHDLKPVLTMLILDAKFSESLTTVSLCVQRPQLLVALDFLLAIAEFFVPTVRGMLSNDEDDHPLHIVDATILNEPIYFQPFTEFSLSPQRPLIADDERFDHFIYDGKGGNLYLQDRQGINLSCPSAEPIIYVGSGKRLQFKNVLIKNGEYLDSCILLGADSSYSVSEDDHVFLERGNIGLQNYSEEKTESVPAPSSVADRPTEFIIELQAIGPELTFYNSSKDVGESMMLSTKLLHAQLDVFCRLVLKGDTIEMGANALGLTVESNGVKVLEPFDTCVKFSNAHGKTNILIAVSDVFMNFSFSILRLFLAVEEDILTFLRMTSKKSTVVCSQFDNVGTIQYQENSQTCAFWRPRAPPGFAVLGDCFTPLNEPPTKGVLAVNTSFARVKRPVSFKLIWPPSVSCDSQGTDSGIREFVRTVPNTADSEKQSSCSIWFPIAPQGYVALGCVVSAGRTQPPLSSALCILASLVSPCALKDCITLSFPELYASSLAFWRVDNSVGSFLPADPINICLDGKAYDLRHMFFGYSGESSGASKSAIIGDIPSDHGHTLRMENSAVVTSGRQFEAVASFRLVWWNHGTSSRKKLSIWRPIVPHGMVYLGDIAVQGYEPPNNSVVLHESGDETLLKVPVDFQLVGGIKKQKGIENISFWLPLAPPGFVSLGCVACKGTLKAADFGALRCIRGDKVIGDQFPEESIWDTSDVSPTTEPFSIWAVGNEAGTFLVRSGFRKPPKRFALKLADSNSSSGSDDTVINAEIKTFSAAIFDDYGGLMVPLLNISLSGIGFSLHGRPDYLNSSVNFSLAARSYNDKCDSWEPLVEPVDGFVRYLYNLNAPGAASQLRVISTRELNLNISVSNANMLFQAYASWNNLSHAQDSYKKKETTSPTYDGKSIIDVHHRKNYYIIPLNRLGCEIFIRATEIRGLSNIIRMPSGDIKPVKVPVSKNMLDAHLEGKLRIFRTNVTVVISDAELPSVEGLITPQYTLEIRLSPNQCIPSESILLQQSARTRGVISEHSLPSGHASINWSETFFFKVDSPDYYMVELTVTDRGKGEPIGFYSAPLQQIASKLHPSSNSSDSNHKLSWIELLSAKPVMPRGDESTKSHGRVRCAILLSPQSEVENDKRTSTNGSKPGFIQISPAKDGPWTTVRLNYAAPAACWRLGNDVVASEVSVKDGDRYVNIRSLVSVTNNTDFVIDLCLNSKASREKLKLIDDGNVKHEERENDESRFETDEFFEIEKYNPSIGCWVSCSPQTASSDQSSVGYRENGYSSQGISEVELPSGWEVTDDWHVDNTLIKTSEGWVYAPDLEHLKWPDSFNHINSVNFARQRRWIRRRKCISRDVNRQVLIGLLRPGDSISLPLLVLTHTELSYFLQLRPMNVGAPKEYSWSSVVDRISGMSESSGNSEEFSEICVSSLTECEKLLYCPQISGSSSEISQGLSFSLSIQATEIGKDINSNPILDWNLVVNSPLSFTNFLPLPAEYSVLEKLPSGHFFTSSRGVFGPGKTIKVYNADLRNPLYFSLLPQGGWQPVHEAVLISHPSRIPSKTISLRSSFSGRIIQVILDQNQDKEQQFVAKVVRIYTPYWFASARCPPLTYRFVDISGRRERWHFSRPFQTNQILEKVVGEITEDEIFEGYTIDSALNFGLLGLSVSISSPEKERFGPAKELSPLGSMDGSIDLYAYDADGNCIRLFVSSKPCPYPSVPTKVISVRPFVTFTNRLGQDLFVKLNSGDQPKVLHASDSRVSFVYCEAGGPEKLQVRLEDTEWCFPVEILKEDTITTVLRKHTGGRRFLRTEIRGYEEGSRFLIIFRLGSANGPLRIENRTSGMAINIRQSGLSDDTWIQLQPLSTTNFSWEDPYGQKFLDVGILRGNDLKVQKFSLERTGECMIDESMRVQLRVVEMGDIMIAQFIDDQKTLELSSHEKTEAPASIGNWSTPYIQSKVQNNASPIELIIELGVVGISLIDQRPRELLYLYLERVFISYSSGYDGGTTSRFKLILGHLQLDNQLPLTLMPVLLAPEHITDANHPVFKMTVTMSNENTDGTQIYPYVYIRVTEKCWRVSIHEPIIWVLVDFYNNLRIDSIPSSSGVAQVDPEIRIDLIDVSEVRLKLSMETAPTQRPQGVLGMWSPILSAVGNAFKIQVHLRKVMHKNRFMRKSSVVPAIVNRICRDLIHNPLHLIFAVDVLGMTSSTLASLSKGFAELSTDGQFLQLRSKQVGSRRITGVSDGILRGTEALAQGFAFGVSGVVTKPMESARQHGILGLAHGLGRAFLGFIVQPVSGALDFVSLTVDGIGASCTRCLEVFSNKATYQRIRNPRAILANGVLMEYCEKEALGQMVLHLAEASRHFGCTEIFKEPSKYAWSDHYEDHFTLPYRRILLITNKRVMLLQCLAPDKMDKKPCKIMWDVPWEELMTLELAKAGYPKPSHLILHLKNFKKSESFVRLIKCSVEEEGEGEPQAVKICLVVRKMWKMHQSDMKTLTLKVPSSQRYVHFAWDEADGRNSRSQIKPMIRSREFPSVSSVSGERKFIKHSVNFQRIWSSEQDSKGRCTLCPKQVVQDGEICSIWRPISPDGYISIGDVTRVGIHPPNVAAVYRNIDGLFATPVGYDLVWRNCLDDYVTPVSIWLPRAPEGFVSVGCVAVAGFTEPQPDTAYCVSETVAEKSVFEERIVWAAPDLYPWACYVYQVQSEALHFIALRQPKQETDWTPMRVSEVQPLESLEA